MCTVTFIPGRDKIFLTSNRDEKNFRSPALPPRIYEFDSGKILFPKDGDAGGSWIASHENGNAIVFLNGGLIFHKSMPPYKKSRGLILIDLIDSATPYNSFLAINLANIEPFTAIIWDDNHLFECRWDGKQKHYQEMDKTISHIWSSVTLYDEQVIGKRKSWFDEWVNNNKEPLQKEILHFHQFTGDGDSNNDLLMNRNGNVYTVSITSMAIGEEMINMEYLDLKSNKSSVFDLSIEKPMASR